MTIPASDLNTLTPDAQIELYTLDLNPIGVNQLVHFCNWNQTSGANVSFAGVEYAAYPIQASGFELSGRGQLPTPTLQVSNVFRDITKLILDYDDLVGAKLTRRRTFAKYLDGQPQADSTKEFDPDIYYVERKASENKLTVSFELSAALDLGDFRLPARKIVANACPWRYRSPECGYAGGPVADKQDRPTSDPALDDCSKLISGCRLRFGFYGVLNFGGFPGAGLGGR